MSHDLKDPLEFLVTPRTTTGNRILVQKLNVAITHTPIQPNNWEDVIILSSTSTLRINGQKVPDNRLVPLMNKLKNEHLMVNCQGLCFLKTTINSGSVYIRLFDAFSWPVYGITNFKFVGFSTPKHLDGRPIKPINLSPNTIIGSSSSTTADQASVLSPTLLPFSNLPMDDGGCLRQIILDNFRPVLSSTFVMATRENETYWRGGVINYDIDDITPSSVKVSYPTTRVKIYHNKAGNFFETNNWFFISTNNGTRRFAFYGGRYNVASYYSQLKPGNMVYILFSTSFKSNNSFFRFYILRGVGIVFGFYY